MRLIGLDPGGTTGFTVCDFMELPDGQIQNVKWDMGQIVGDYHHRELYQWLDARRDEVDADSSNLRVVCESFEYRKGLRDNVVLVSLEYIGVTKLFCDDYSVRLQMQTAAVGKAFFWPSSTRPKREDRLKAVGLYKPGSPHWNDATRHALHYLCFNSPWKNSSYVHGLLRRLS